MDFRVGDVLAPISGTSARYKIIKLTETKVTIECVKAGIKSLIGMRESFNIKGLDGPNRLARMFKIVAKSNLPTSNFKVGDIIKDTQGLSKDEHYECKVIGIYEKGLQLRILKSEFAKVGSIFTLAEPWVEMIINRLDDEFVIERKDNVANTEADIKRNEEAHKELMKLVKKIEKAMKKKDEKVKFKVGDVIKSIKGSATFKIISIDEENMNIKCLSSKHKDCVGKILTLWKVNGSFSSVYNNFELVKKAKETIPDKIEIIFNDRATTALYKSEGKVLARGLAKCNPEDEYNRTFGMNLALGRLLYNMSQNGIKM